jgi:hypothetical protein
MAGTRGDLAKGQQDAADPLRFPWSTFKGRVHAEGRHFWYYRKHKIERNEVSHA